MIIVLLNTLELGIEVSLKIGGFSLSLNKNLNHGKPL